jgi:hypothetical protein
MSSRASEARWARPFTEAFLRAREAVEKRIWRWSLKPDPFFRDNRSFRVEPRESLYRFLHQFLSAVCYSIVIAISLATNRRMNKAYRRLVNPAPPDNWKAIRTRWVRFHSVRTLFSFPGLACYILACLVNR